MLRILIYSILFIACLLYMAETKITLYPFKVEFARGWLVLGLIFIGVGVGFVGYQGYKDGAAQGIDATFKYLKEEIKKKP